MTLRTPACVVGRLSCSCYSSVWLNSDVLSRKETDERADGALG